MKKINVLIISLILGMMMLVGCQQLELGGTQEPVICVPVSNISSICDQVDDDVGETIEEVEDDLDETDMEEEIEEVIEELNVTIEVNETEEETVEEEVVEEEPVEADYTVTEGELLVISPKAVDPDGDPLIFTFSEPLDENGSWQTGAGDAGLYTVDISVSDGVNVVTKQVAILVVAMANAAPTIEGLADISVDEGETVSVSPTVSDADGDVVTVTISDPVGDDGVWETGYDDAGEYEVTVTANDGENEVSQTITVAVNNINRAPVIESLTAAQIEEGEIVSVNVVATDADGDVLAISFEEPLNATGGWETVVGDAGEYVVAVTVSDGEDSDTKTISLSVNAANQAPVIEGLSGISVDEGETVTIAPIVTDPDGDVVTVTISDPVGDDGVWETGYDDAGEYEVTVTASDGINTVSQTIDIVVLDKNRPPVFE